MPSKDPSSAELRLFGLPQPAAGPTSRDPVEQLATEYLDALRRGDAPAIETYIARFPEQEGQIRDLFPMIAALEDWKTDREQVVTRGPMPERFDIQQLGDCRILRELGRGGMGVVFEAEQAPIGRRVAVKLLPWRFSTQSRWRERFQQEARTAAALKHPHIVSIYSFGEQEGMAYYVMHLVEGVGLNRLIERLRSGSGIVTTADIAADFRAAAPAENQLQPAPSSGGVLRRDAWPAIIRIALQAADALRHAHKLGTLHRDIKPANLMIDTRGTVWVGDFGLAVPMEAANADARTSLAGTLRYMAPEQLAGQVDERSDLYAFGLTLYELCTLRPAFDMHDRRELIDAIVGSTPPRPRQINSDIPRRLEAIILKSIAPQPEARYQRVEELMADLRSYLARGEWSLFRWPFGRRKR